MKNILSAILIALIPAVTLAQDNQDVPTDSDDGFGWHQVTLNSGDQLTVKVLKKTDENLTGHYQNVYLQIAYEDIKAVHSIKTLWQLGVPASSLPPEREIKIRDAIEDLSSKDIHKARRAISLIESEFPACRPILHEHKSNPLSRVRRIVAKTLGLKGSADKDGNILTYFLNDSDRSVRLLTLRALKEFGREFEETLSKHLQRESDLKLKREILKTLSRWKSEYALSYILTSWESESEDDASKIGSHYIKALKKITRQDFGQEPEQWRKQLVFLQAERETQSTSVELINELNTQ